LRRAFGHTVGSRRAIVKKLEIVGPTRDWTRGVCALRYDHLGWTLSPSGQRIVEETERRLRNEMHGLQDAVLTRLGNLDDLIAAEPRYARAEDRLAFAFGGGCGRD